MRSTTKEVIGLMTLSIALFLILTHSQGFARSLRAGSSSFVEITRVLQGR